MAGLLSMAAPICGKVGSGLAIKHLSISWRQYRCIQMSYDLCLAIHCIRQRLPRFSFLFSVSGATHPYALATFRNTRRSNSLMIERGEWAVSAKGEQPFPPDSFALPFS